MVLPDSDSLPRVESYSGIPLGLCPCHLRDFHPLWSIIPDRSVKNSGPPRSYNPGKASPSGLGYSAFARRYLRSRGFFLFLQVMRCFSSLGSLGYSRIKARLTAPPDFSQFATPFSLLVPRHPPHALNSLATLFPSSARVYHSLPNRTTSAILGPLSHWDKSTEFFY